MNKPSHWYSKKDLIRLSQLGFLTIEDLNDKFTDKDTLVTTMKANYAWHYANVKNLSERNPTDTSWNIYYNDCMALPFKELYSRALRELLEAKQGTS